MYRSAAMNFHRRFLQSQLANRVNKPCDVFINHRGVDTKRSIASLLYDHFSRLSIHPFLDNKNMKPGDKLLEKIDAAIRECKIFVALFSPRYCSSYYCLHELALITESKKKVIPIFCDVKPSQLRVVDNGICCSAEDVRRFNNALEEAKNTVGLDFDSSKGNWADVVTSASDIVIKSLVEMEDERPVRRQRNAVPFYYTTTPTYANNIKYLMKGRI